MRLSVITLLLLVPTAVIAQNYQGMNEADMQKMMQQAQKAQACMQNVNQQNLQALGNRAKQMETEINALCAAGKRSEAEKKALKFGLDISKDPDVQAARKCGDLMRGAMPTARLMQQPEKTSGRHICDD